VIVARYMSTHAIKTELQAVLGEIEPEKKWHGGTTVRELADFALDTLDRSSPDLRVQRAIELADAVRPRLN
jgi:hypothetical protein